jgi:hypothetical protein
LVARLAGRQAAHSTSRKRQSAAPPVKLPSTAAALVATRVTVAIAPPPPVPPHHSRQLHTNLGGYRTDITRNSYAVHQLSLASEVTIGAIATENVNCTTITASHPIGELPRRLRREASMHGLIYLIGLIVVILFILSLLGLR